MPISFVALNFLPSVGVMISGGLSDCSFGEAGGIRDRTKKKPEV